MSLRKVYPKFYFQDLEEPSFGDQVPFEKVPPRIVYPKSTDFQDQVSFSNRIVILYLNKDQQGRHNKGYFAFYINQCAAENEYFSYRKPDYLNCNRYVPFLKL